MRAVLRCLLELVQRREQVLDGVVVQTLCESLPLPLLGRQRIGEQPRARVGEMQHRLRAPRQQRREEDAGGAHPREVAGVRRDDLVVAGRRGMGERLDHVRSDGRRGADAVIAGRNRNATETGIRK